MARVTKSTRGRKNDEPFLYLRPADAQTHLVVAAPPARHTPAALQAAFSLSPQPTSPPPRPPRPSSPLLTRAPMRAAQGSRWAGIDQICGATPAPWRLLRGSRCQPADEGRSSAPQCVPSWRWPSPASVGSRCSPSTGAPGLVPLRALRSPRRRCPGAASSRQRADASAARLLIRRRRPGVQPLRPRRACRRAQPGASTP